MAVRTKKGLYFEIEGPEGSYKSTVVNKLEERLKASGYEVEVVRQPGGTKMSEHFRDIIKYGYCVCENAIKFGKCECDEAEKLTSHGMFHLFMVTRAQLHENVIAPLVAQGKIVISDRGNLSSIGYQGYGLGVSLEMMEACIANADWMVKPNILFHVDISYELSQKRCGIRGTTDNIEEMGASFHRKVIEGYRDYGKSSRINNICKHYELVPGVREDGYEFTSDELADKTYDAIINELKASTGAA